MTVLQPPVQNSMVMWVFFIVGFQRTGFTVNSINSHFFLTNCQVWSLNETYLTSAFYICGKPEIINILDLKMLAKAMWLTKYVLACKHFNCISVKVSMIMYMYLRKFWHQQKHWQYYTGMQSYKHFNMLTFSLLNSDHSVICKQLGST